MFLRSSVKMQSLFANRQVFDVDPLKWPGLFLLIEHLEGLAEDRYPKALKWRLLISHLNGTASVKREEIGRFNMKHYTEITQIMKCSDFIKWLQEINRKDYLNKSDKWDTLMSYLNVRRVVCDEKEGVEVMTKDEGLPEKDLVIRTWLIDTVKNSDVNWDKAYVELGKTKDQSPHHCKFYEAYDRWELPVRDRWVRMFSAVRFNVVPKMSPNDANQPGAAQPA
jgi:hypothetical protein